MTTPDTIGRFRIERQVGRGTTGIVYLAWDPSLNRRIAIKLLAPVVEPEGEARKLASFERELRAAGGLSHPNIVTVHDVGHHDDRPFIAMEYIEGRTLEEIVRTGGDLPPAKIVDIGRQIAAALDHAHARSVIHRDVKLSNILLGADGTAKLTDFGVAKLPYSDETLAGTAMGTPSYMAPETLVGRRVTGASDQFSLAVGLFELLTGERPFAGPTSQAVMYRIVNEKPTSPSSLARELPDEVDGVFARALEKDPEKRYPSCAEMADALGTAMGVPGPDRIRPAVAARIQKRFTPVPKTPAGRKLAAPPETRPVGSRRGIAGIAVGLAAMAVVALVAWLLVGRATAPGEAPAPAERVARDERPQPEPVAEPPKGRLESATEILGPGAAVAEAPPEEAVTPDEGSPAPAPRVAAEPARTVRVVSRPAGARVLLNSRALEGVTPMEALLEPGVEYTFRVELDGHVPAGVSVSLASLSAEQADSGVLFFPLREEEPAPRATVTESLVAETAREPAPAAPGTVDLAIRLVSEVRRGVLMVYRGEEQLLREDFRFQEAVGSGDGDGSPGVLERRVEVASGPAELRVYVMLRDRPANLVVLATELEAGASPVLIVSVAGDGGPSLELR